MHPGFDYGLTSTTYWTGVQRLPADRRLQIAHGELNSRVWWTPPPASLSAAEGAPLVRQALESAVQVRGQSGDQISADLSGGMDSTSLCFLLTEQKVPYAAFVERTIDPNHDDARWAQLAADTLHQPLTVLQPHELPDPYDDIITDDGEINDDLPYGIGAPYTLIRNRTRKIELAKKLAAVGSTTHLAGFGGDELFTVAPSYFSDLYGQSRLRALREIRTLASLRRWRWSAILRALSNQQSYGSWFQEQLQQLQSSRDSTVPTVGWGPQLRLPPWATGEAADIIRAEAQPTIETVQSQAQDRATHTALAGQRIGGERLAPLRELMANSGIRLSLPFMDDHVVEAALSVSRAESLPGVEYKPLLKMAMNESRTEGALSRSTKGEFSMSVQRGLSKNRDRLLRLFEGSTLAEQGLVDLDKLRSSIRDTMRPQHETAALELTVAAEVWNRVVRTEVGQHDLVSPHPAERTGQGL